MDTGEQPTLSGSDRRDIERIVEVKLDAEEKKQFDSSVKAVKGLVDVVKKMDRQSKSKKK